MFSLHKNVWILTVAQALMMSTGSIFIFVGGIIGSKIAPQESFATLPFASLIVGSALSSIPVTLIMKNLGRKLAFFLISIYAILVSLMTAYYLSQGSFWMLCMSCALLGIVVSCVNQFRFAAMESVPADQIPKAASTVLIGGILAAFIGPEIATMGKSLFVTDYVGSFVLLAGVYFLSGIILLFYQNTVTTTSEQEFKGRSLGVIALQPIFWVAVSTAMVGYAVMSFIMTATPVSMHMIDGHALHHTKWVIQSHIVAMFLPSLFTGWIINKFGIFKVIIAGLVLFGLCIIMALAGHMLYNYWVSLTLLGIGWNFLFIGGTSLLPQAYEPNERFKVQAMNEFLVFGTQSLAALSAGYVVYNFGWEKMLFFTIPMLMIPVVAILYHQLKARRTKDEF